ncbi:MAG: exopolyphosphatase [Cyclobacteriaceae bacterium]|nr:exopolyphosphatase [Cyclobacteriaceae bacterium]
MNERIAIVDMGTNTFLLLIAEKNGRELKSIYQDRVATKIGKGGINGGFITDEAIDRAMTALKQFDQKAKEMDVTKAVAIGTSAIRNASNQQALINRIQEETSFLPKVISGEEEADLIYRGVRQAIVIPPSKALIVDIGGGSVEFIIADAQEAFWKQSFEIGGQRLIERFHHHDPILPEEIESIQHYVNEKLAPLFEALAKWKPEVLIGVSGSFDTLSEIYCRQNSIPFNNEPETPLSIEAFHSISRSLYSKTRDERMQIPGMIELRVDMIVVGCCLIQCLLDRYSFARVTVSSYSLKEGVLATL